MTKCAENIVHRVGLIYNKLHTCSIWHTNCLCNMSLLFHCWLPVSASKGHRQANIYKTTKKCWCIWNKNVNIYWIPFTIFSTPYSCYQLWMYCLWYGVMKCYDVRWMDFQTFRCIDNLEILILLILNYKICSRICLKCVMTVASTYTSI